MKISSYILTLSLVFVQLSTIFAQNYHFNHRYLGVEEGLSNGKVNAFFQDSRGLIWIATEQGLNRFNGYDFTWWTEKEGLSASKIQQILEDPYCKLWVISSKKVGKITVPRLDIINIITGKISSFEESYGVKLPFSLTEEVEISGAEQQKILIHTKEKTIQFDVVDGFQTLEFKPALPKNKPAQKHPLNATTWRLQDGTLSISDEKGELIETFGTATFNKKIRRLFFDQLGLAWLATEDGFYLLEMKENHFQTVDKSTIPAKETTVKPSKIQGAAALYRQLPAIEINHIHQDKAGIYWLATTKNGLVRWDATKQQKKQFFLNNGLFNNELYAVYEDDFNYLWISSRYGLNQFDKKTKNHYAYFKNDGTAVERYEKQAHFQAADGRLYFGGANGGISLDPVDFSKGKIDRGEIRLESMSLTPKPDSYFIIEATETYENGGQIPLRPSEKPFITKFFSTDYFNTPAIVFSGSIKMKKFKPRQDYTKKITFIGNSMHLINMPSGIYTLELRGKQKNGAAYLKPLRFELNHDFFLTGRGFFPVLLGASFLLILLTIWTLRVQQLKRNQRRLEEQVSERTETILKQTEKLQALDKAKSRFFANVSHELRTPLTLILGPVQSILSRNKLDNRDFTFLKLIEQNTKDLQKRVNQLLDISKLDSNKLIVKESPINLYIFTYRLSSAFEANAQNRDILYVFNYTLRKDLNLLLDEEKFENIFNNFLSNALKYTPEKGQIEVSIKEEQKDLILAVNDTGPGIHLEDLPHIFERFYQAKNENSAEGGTGIGLAFCRELAKLMNGKVWVESELDKGSTFYLQVPIKEVLGRNETPKEILENTTFNPDLEQLVLEKSTLSTNTILVVEDNYSLREYISVILEDYTVLTAANGKDALEALEENPTIELIISDVMMPVMDGFEFLQQLKSTKLWKSIPVIMLTARADIQDKLTALRIGVDDYLIKPFVNEELLTRIGNLLENSALRQANTKEQLLNNKKRTAKTPKPKKVNQKWLAKVEIAVKRSLQSKNFKLDTLAQELDISLSQLQRKIKQNTGLTANQYIREIKLHQARQILEKGEVKTVAEVSYAIGFEDQHYFSTLFAKRFGKKPSEYL